MVIVISHSDRHQERGYHGAFGGMIPSQAINLELRFLFKAVWQLTGWILLRCLPSNVGRGVKYFAAVVVASWPYNHPLNIAWMSENTM